MQKKLHNFMDKMQEKPLEERQKLLVVSTVVLGSLVLVVGVWNISSNFVALNQSKVEESNLAATDVSSVSEKLRTEAASVWGSVQGGLKNINDKLGPDQQ